jgi:HNH endonuclease
MLSFQCALCNVVLTPENNSREHLLPNGIGGQKAVRNVLCKPCNDRTGAEWDAIVSKQLNFLNLLFGIKRDRGEVQAENFKTVSGQTIRKHPDGHLTFPRQEPTRIQTDQGVRIETRVATEQEAKAFLLGLKRRNPKLDIEEQLRGIRVEHTYLSDPIFTTMQPGGAEAGRSFVKSAYTLAVSSGVKPNDCVEARAYLLNADGMPCFDYFYERDLILNRPTDRVFHCVAVSGNPTTGQLMGYVELYSTWRMVMCLSSQYAGDFFQSSYSVNPVTGEEIRLSFYLNFSRGQLRRACNGKDDYSGELGKAFNAMMEIGYPASLQRERERVLHRAVATAMDQLGVHPGESLSPDQLSEFTRIVTQEITPCLVHQAPMIQSRIRQHSSGSNSDSPLAD